MLHCSRWFFPVLVGQTPPFRNISRSMPLAQRQRQGFLVSVTLVRVSACMSVTPAVSYLFIGLAGCSVGPEISCGACKLAWTPQIKKKKKVGACWKSNPGPLTHKTRSIRKDQTLCYDLWPNNIYKYVFYDAKWIGLCRCGTIYMIVDNCVFFTISAFSRWPWFNESRVACLQISNYNYG